MGATKSEIFTQDQNRLATIAKVLGHPARIAILQELAKRNSCVCGEIVEIVGLAQATVSQHLKELKNADLIQGTIEGTSVCYCINENKWMELKRDLINFMDLDLSAKKCC